MNAKNNEKQKALETLRKAIKPGEVIYTILRHCSASGMRRVIDVYVMRDNEPLGYSWSVAHAIGATYNRKHEGVQVNGCGMDMGFHIVYSLSYALGFEGEDRLRHRWI